MLGKLIKYDLKSTSKVLILVHAFLLLSAFLMRIFMTGQIQLEDVEDSSNILMALTILLYSLIVMGASFATSIIVAVRFYKNLFSDEGYLTNTLPVSRGILLLAKTISGGIWTAVDMALLLLSIYIVAFPPNVMELFQDNKEAVMEAMGFTGSYTLPSVPAIVGFLLILSLLSGFSSVAMIYASVVLGQLFSSHRVIGAVACYFAISTIFSMISYAIMLVIGLSSQALVPSDGSSSMYLGEYLGKTIQFSVVWSVITGIILYLITWKIFSRKINLS
ncbi:hypothetical protein FND36_07315 [Lachnospiraceae bacterium KGMB03038]|nr:hypothetical protein FND36_07315 [Lachnospiraceae bacterium KGMB03038]